MQHVRSSVFICTYVTSDQLLNADHQFKPLQTMS